MLSVGVDVEKSVSRFEGKGPRLSIGVRDKSM